MKELDPFILLAVFQEMLGPLLWILLAVVVLGLVGSTILAYTIAGWWPARRQLTDTANAR